MTSDPAAPALRAPRGLPGRSSLEPLFLPWLLLLPALAVVLGLVLYPLGRTVYLSFTDAGLETLVQGTTRIVGLDNYRALLEDAHVRKVFLNTVVFGAACVAGTMLLGFWVAMLLHQRFRGRTLLGVLVLLPWAVPSVAAGLVWRWIFDDQFGLLNWAFALGDHPWFNDRLSAFAAVWVVVVWQSFPFIAITILAGLSTIPRELLEAASVDGASSLQRLRYVTVPLLKPLLVLLTLISTIWDFKIFDQVYVMTAGGPAGSTELVSLTVFSLAFGKLEFGPASALAMLLFLVLAALTLVYMRIARSHEGALS